jgi:hypothetical protein
VGRRARAALIHAALAAKDASELAAYRQRSGISAEAREGLKALLSSTATRRSWRSRRVLAAARPACARR